MIARLYPDETFQKQKNTNNKKKRRRQKAQANYTLYFKLSFPSEVAFVYDPSSPETYI